MFFRLFASAAARRTPLIRVLLPLAVVFVAGTLGSAQSGGGIDMTGTDGKDIIQGRIIFPSGQRVDSRLKVKLETMNSGELSVFADLNGSFSFRSLGPGSYNVVIDGGKEYETARENVYIAEERRGVLRSASSNTPRIYNIILYLQPKPDASGNPKASVVDASLANAPGSAVDHYNRAMEAIRAGNAAKAIVELEAAVSIYSEFTVALNELGVQYLRTGKIEKAVVVLRQALKTAPNNSSALLNYGVALLEKSDFTAAELPLRQATQKSNSSATAHYYLGIDLIKLKKLTEAETELVTAARLGGDQMPLAHMYLGGIYWGKKDYARAVVELETYLRLSPNAANAEQIRNTVRELRAKV